MRLYVALLSLTLVSVLAPALVVLAASLGWIGEATARQFVIVAFVVAVASAIPGGILQYQYQQKTWRILAETLGLRPEDAPAGANIDRNTMLVGDYGKHNVMARSQQITTVRMHSGSRRNSNRRRITQFGVFSKNGDPDFWFQLLRNSSTDYFETIPGNEGFDTGDKSTDRLYTAGTNDASLARRLYDTKIKGFLSNRNNVVEEFRIDKGRVMVTLRGFTAETQDVRSCLDVMSRIADELESRPAMTTASVSDGVPRGV